MMNKIVIIGSGGSGKSTLSMLLGKKLSLPVYHLDSLYWRPGWQRMETTQWETLQKELCNKTHWIIDGNYQSTLDIRIEACDTIIFLDVNRFKCIYRAIKRTLTNENRPDMGKGCNERIDLAFIKFLWNYPKKSRPIIIDKLNTVAKDKDIIIARSAKQALLFCQ